MRMMRATDKPTGKISSEMKQRIDTTRALAIQQ